jgi:hypothetical protein
VNLPLLCRVVCPVVVSSFLTLGICTQRSHGQDWGVSGIGDETELTVAVADSTNLQDGFDWYAEAEIDYGYLYTDSIGLEAELSSSNSDGADLGPPSEDVEVEDAYVEGTEPLWPGVTYYLDASTYVCVDSSYDEVPNYYIDDSCYFDIGIDIAFTAGVPSISSITPTSDAIGNSGQITAQGQYLGDPFGGGFTSCSLTGPGGSQGVSLSGGNSSNNFSTYTVNYSIAQNATPGTYYFTVTNPFGTSNQVAFSVGDDTPNITGISPNTWNAGVTTPVVITGQHFGTNAPTLTFSDPNISYALSSYSDGQIVASIAVAANDPGGNLNLSVTSNGYSGNGFMPVPGQSSTSSQAGAAVAPIPAAGPNILYNGEDVVGDPQGNIVVGQQIALTEDVPSPQNQYIKSRSWNVTSGTAIGGYPTAPAMSTTSGSVSLTPLSSTCSSSSTCTLYWVSPGNSLTVDYSYTLTNGQTSPSVSATFNVQGPSTPNLTTPTISPVTVSLVNNLLYMGMFSPPATPGIVFDAQVQQPEAAQGEIVFVQYLNQYNYQYTTSGSCPLQSYGPGFDTGYPYDLSSVGALTYSTNDTPGIPLYTNASEATASFNATTYLMWQPNLPSSSVIPVPLGSITWQWSGDAVQNGGTWSLNPTASPTASAFTPSANYPPNGSIITIAQQPPCGLHY